MRGSSGEGWSVVIAVDGDDAAKEAVRLLGDDWSTYPALAPPPGMTFSVAGWEVGVAASTSEDGEQTVAYSILPD